MRYFIGTIVLSVAGLGFFIFHGISNNVEVDVHNQTGNLAAVSSNGQLPENTAVPEANSTKANPTNTDKQLEERLSKSSDIGPQNKLANPPSVIRAIYSTGWTAGTPSRISSLIKLIKSTNGEINAVVIDVKDFSGNFAYVANLPQAEKYGAFNEPRISHINAVIKELHDNNIYVIARITIFQDPILAKARPDLTIKSKKTGKSWLDRRGLAWIDPASKDAWDYNIALAKDASSRGFDEINFDYIRFASDGDLPDMEFPHWDGKTPKHKTIAQFFSYLHDQMQGTKISADLFGLATVNKDDLGIGQIIEDAYKYFDYVAPMVYPSHYAPGFLGYKSPANYPYEVVKYSMTAANNRLTNASSTYTAKLRPWLQDFNLGATYDAAMVKKQIQAVSDSGLHDGYMMWDPRNIYTSTKAAVTQ